MLIYFSLSIVAEAEKAGIESAGGKAEIYQYDYVPSPN